MLLSLLVGPILDKHGDYLVLFVMAAFSYLLALGVIHLILPRLEPMQAEPRV